MRKREDSYFERDLGGGLKSGEPRVDNRKTLGRNTGVRQPIVVGADTRTTPVRRHGTGEGPIPRWAGDSHTPTRGRVVFSARKPPSQVRKRVLPVGTGYAPGAHGVVTLPDKVPRHTPSVPCRRGRRTRFGDPRPHPRGPVGTVPVEGPTSILCAKDGRVERDTGVLSARLPPVHVVGAGSATPDRRGPRRAGGTWTSRLPSRFSAGDPRASRLGEVLKPVHPKTEAKIRPVQTTKVKDTRQWTWTN